VRELVTFGERFTLLQMPISLAAPPRRWAGGLPGGGVERDPSPTEWPVQGWSRVEVGGAPLAIVTNDVYSVSLEGSCWQWTLLRSPRMAWMGENPPVYAGRDWHTDQGSHTFRFVLHAGGDLGDAALAGKARQQAQPRIVFSRYEGMDRPPWPAVPPRHLWGPAEERARTE